MRIRFGILLLSWKTFFKSLENNLKPYFQIKDWELLVQSKICKTRVPSKELIFLMHTTSWLILKCNIKIDILWGSCILLQTKKNSTKFMNTRWSILKQVSKKNLPSSTIFRISSACQGFLQLLWHLDAQQICQKNWMTFSKQRFLVKQLSAKCSSSWLLRLTRSMRCHLSFAMKTMCFRMFLSYHNQRHQKFFK